MANKTNKEFIMDFEKGIITQTNTYLDPLDEECRICFEKGTLIYPCNCNSGIHLKCLKKWIISEQNTSPKECEICKHPYRIAYNKLFPEQNIFNSTPPPPSRQINMTLYPPQPPPPPPPPPSRQVSMIPHPPLPPNLSLSSNMLENVNPRQIIPRIDPDSWTENRYNQDEGLSRIIVNERHRVSHNIRIVWFEDGFIILFVSDMISLIVYFTCGNDLVCSNGSGIAALIISGLIVLLFIYYWLSIASVRASVSDNR